MPDPEGSAFFPAWRDGESRAASEPGSRIEGIGRPRVEPSFVGQVIDRMVQVPDAASVGAMREVEAVLGRRVGPSTGTNLWAAFGLVAQMRAAGTAGSIVTLLCDSGDRYARTYYDDGWVAEQGWDLAPYRAAVREFLRTADAGPSRSRPAARAVTEPTDDRRRATWRPPGCRSCWPTCEQLVELRVAVRRPGRGAAQRRPDRRDRHPRGWVSAPERVEVDGCSHLRWRFGPGPNRVVILAHHDTVWPLGSLATHPWSIAGGVIRGPGTVDMKAGLVQAIYALAVLQERGVDLTGVCLLVTGDEEIGSPTSRALIEDEARGCAAMFRAGGRRARWLAEDRPEGHLVVPDRDHRPGGACRRRTGEGHQRGASNWPT